MQHVALLACILSSHAADYMHAQATWATAHLGQLRGTIDAVHNVLSWLQCLDDSGHQAGVTPGKQLLALCRG